MHFKGWFRDIDGIDNEAAELGACGATVGAWSEPLVDSSMLTLNVADNRPAEEGEVDWSGLAI